MSDTRFERERDTSQSPPGLGSDLEEMLVLYGHVPPQGGSKLATTSVLDVSPTVHGGRTALSTAATIVPEDHIVNVLKRLYDLDGVEILGPAVGLPIRALLPEPGRFEITLQLGPPVSQQWLDATIFCLSRVPGSAPLLSAIAVDPEPNASRDEVQLTVEAPEIFEHLLPGSEHASHAFLFAARSLHRDPRDLGLFEWRDDSGGGGGGGNRGPSRRPFDLPPNAIVLLHGLWSGGQRFADLARAARAQDFDVFLYEYDFRDSVQRNGNALAEELRATPLGQRVHLVAHSMGGLVARHAIANRAGHEHASTLVMLGTPNRGAVTRRSLLSLANLTLGTAAMLRAVFWKADGVRDITNPQFLRENFTGAHAGATQYVTIPGWGSQSREGAPFSSRVWQAVRDRALGLAHPHDGVVANESVDLASENVALREQFAPGVAPLHWAQYSRIDRTLHVDLPDEAQVVAHVLSVCRSQAGRRRKRRS